MVNGPEDSCLVTVMQVRGAEVTLLVSHGSSRALNGFDSWTATLSPDSSFRIGDTTEIRLIDVRGGRKRTSE